MITCLTDYVTLSEGCSPTAPGSGVYLDKRWPQVRTVNLESLTGTKYRTVDELWAGIYERSLLAFEGDVRSGMKRQFTRTDVVRGITSHEIDSPFTETTAADEMRGVYIEVGGSVYADLHVSQVKMYCPFAATVPIYILDANTGNLLDTINLTATGKGYVTAQVNKTYSIAGETSKFFIGYNASAQTSADTKSLESFGNGCHCDCSGYDSEEFVQVTGGSLPSPATTPIIEENIVKSGNSYGLIVTANYSCAVGNFICNHREALLEAFLYRLLIEFLLEAYHSDRVNAFTIYNDRDEIDSQLYGNPDNPRHVGLYDQMNDKISRALDQIDPVDWICFDCDGDVSRVSTIP